MSFSQRAYVKLKYSQNHTLKVDVRIYSVYQQLTKLQISHSLEKLLAVARVPLDPIAEQVSWRSLGNTESGKHSPL
jgi:hypothetical protein